MTCPNCSNELAADARFCSRCGKELRAVPPPRATKQRDWDTHVNVLGWLLITCGVMIGMGGLMVVFAGHVFGRLPMGWPPGMPFPVRSIVGPLSVMIGLSIITVSAGLSAAGVGLLRYREWARILALILCIFTVFHFPIGTAIAIYACWVLLSEEGRRHYTSRSTVISTASH